MILSRAKLQDLEMIVEFYNKIVDETVDMGKYARWKKGIYPTESDIRGYIDKCAMYLYVENEKIIGAMAVTMSQGEDYHSVLWEEKLQDDEVAVVHIVGVNPDYQGKGIAKDMIDASIKLAEDTGKKSIRLDSLSSNTPAQHIYEGKGFIYRGKQNLYAGNTGWTDFYFYERRI